ncbi:bifunctional DNA primase/polymerase [Gammaproteobacteria bacterium]|nr:bifunctional DNA primase/polymerase [Gammaproteobacteria bacterium]
MSLPFDRGFSYVPIPAGMKGPITPGWNQRKSCITDLTGAHKLSANVGLAHAYCETSTCAVDVDNGKEALRYLAGKGSDLNSLLTKRGPAVMWSGRPNSLKAIYRLPEGVSPLLTKTVKVNGKIILEFRCATADGKTVQDVIPPSIHPSGTKYRWLQGSLESLTELPKELLDLWQELIEADQTENQAQKKTKPAWCAPVPLTPREVAILKDQLNYIDPGCDYETWRNVVFAILSTGLPAAEDIARAWSEGSPEKFDEGAFYTLTNSYIEGRSGLNGSITRGTIYHYARAGGWNG